MRNQKKLLVCVVVLATTAVLAACGGPEEKKAKFHSRAQEFFDKGDVVKARLEVEHALQIDPKFAEGYELLGRIEQNEGNLRGAFGAFSQAAAHWEQALPFLRDQPDAGREIRTTVSLAGAYQAMGQHRRTVDLLEAALTRAKQTGETAWINLELAWHLTWLVCERIGLNAHALDWLLSPRAHCGGATSRSDVVGRTGDTTPMLRTAVTSSGDCSRAASN